MSFLKKLSGKKEEVKTVAVKDPDLPSCPKGICWQPPDGMDVKEYIIKWAGYYKDRYGGEQEPIRTKPDQTSILFSDSDFDHSIKSKGFSKIKIAVCAVDGHGNESEYSECLEINLVTYGAPKIEVRY